MQNESPHTKCTLFLGWIRKNIVHEVPIIGHTLSERTWDAFQHDMKHFFGMLLGMAAMMAIPMLTETSMAMSASTPIPEHQDKIADLSKKFILMTCYMYVGMFIGGVLFNVGKTALNACKSTPSSALEESDINDLDNGLLNDSIGYAT